MKIKDGFLLRNVADKNIVVPVGAELNFSGMISLNDTATFMWEKLMCKTTYDALLSDILNEYSIDENTARKDLDAFLNKLSELNILED